jgi:hypothetical protein
VLLGKAHSVLAALPGYGFHKVTQPVSVRKAVVVTNSCRKFSPPKTSVINLADLPLIFAPAISEVRHKTKL